MSPVSSSHTQSASEESKESYYNTSQSANNGSFSSSSSGTYDDSYSGSGSKSSTYSYKTKSDKSKTKSDDSKTSPDYPKKDSKKDDDCSDKKKKKPENECFKVVQMVSDPACPPPSGIIGYVYTYTIRKRKRVVKKGMPPKQPYQVVIVKEPPDQVQKKNDDPDQKIKEADDEIDFANRQIARYCRDKQQAKQRRKDAEELRFRHEEREKEKEAKKSRYGSRNDNESRPRSRSHRDSRWTNNSPELNESGRRRTRRDTDPDDECKNACEEFLKNQEPEAQKCFPCPLPAVTIKYFPRNNQRNSKFHQQSKGRNSESDSSEEGEAC